MAGGPPAEAHERGGHGADIPVRPQRPAHAEGGGGGLVPRNDELLSARQAAHAHDGGLPRYLRSGASGRDALLLRRAEPPGQGQLQRHGLHLYPQFAGRRRRAA